MDRVVSVFSVKSQSKVDPFQPAFTCLKLAIETLEHSEKYVQKQQRHENDVCPYLNTFDLECLIKKPTCFQSKSPSCINLFSTNKKKFFKNSNVLEVGISDHHSLIGTALRS